MSSILEGLGQYLDADTIARLGEQIGADPNMTSKAIQIALPVIVSGLANNASSPDGAGALDAALARDHDGSLLDDLGSLLGGGGGGGGNSPALDGIGILAHILEGRQDAVQGGVSRATGLSGSQVLRLLALLAPIVMAYLGRQKQQQNMNADDLGNALQNERTRLDEHESGIGGMLGQMLDKNHDGSVADDIFRMAPGVLGGLFGKS
jgi:hypothetical protein